MPTAVTFYAVVVGLHVVFAIACFGVTLSFPFLGKKAQGTPHTGFALDMIHTLVHRLVYPGILIVAATGFYQMADGDWKFGGDNVWLDVSVGLFILIILISFLISGPALKVARAEYARITEGGNQFVPSPEFLAAIKRTSTAGPIMTVSMLTIAFLMEAKPF